MTGQKFLADSMLGRLARWLRLMGFNVEYADSTDTDEEILEWCDRDKLFLLTRDRELSRRCRSSMFMPSDNYHDQIRIFLSTFEPNDQLYFTRCPMCNGEMKIERTGDYKGEIPDGVRRRFERLFICSRCGKVYWEGSHFDAIRRTIDEITGH